MPADNVTALVIFGATGDLAKIETFPALVGLVERGVLDRAGSWRRQERLEPQQFREYAAASLKLNNMDPASPAATLLAVPLGDLLGVPLGDPLPTRRNPPTTARTMTARPTKPARANFRGDSDRTEPGSSRRRAPSTTGAGMPDSGFAFRRPHRRVDGAGRRTCRIPSSSLSALACHCLPNRST